MGDLGLTATDGKVTTPVPLDAPDSAQNQRRAKAARRRLGIGASGMLPELGGWDKNSANGMTGTIASTTVLDIMTLVRTNESINKAKDAGNMDAHIGFAKALRRVFPTTVAGYLSFRGWIRQETLCD